MFQATNRHQPLMCFDHSFFGWPGGSVVHLSASVGPRRCKRLCSSSSFSLDVCRAACCCRCKRSASAGSCPKMADMGLVWNYMGITMDSMKLNYMGLNGIIFGFKIHMAYDDWHSDLWMFTPPTCGNSSRSPTPRLRFPKSWGYPLIIIHFRLGFSLKPSSVLGVSP